MIAIPSGKSMLEGAAQDCQRPNGVIDFYHPERMVYRVHVMTRKFFGNMTRKLSLTESRNQAQFLGTLSRRNTSVGSANWVKVAEDLVRDALVHHAP